MKLALLLIAATATGAGVCDLCRPTTTPTRSTSAPVTAAPPFQVLAAVAPASVRAATQDTVALHIEGMTCGGCTIATRKVLERLDGVTKADVNYELKRAIVAYDRTKVTVPQMIAAIATLKYTATVIALDTQRGVKAARS
jgi:mercuric ion binding protein